MITTGVLGGHWRAHVTSWGAIEPWDGGPVLDWHIAADDRWHSPQREPAVRQRRIEGTAVVETRVRIPDGDAVQRIWSVPDHGGLTFVEVENSSPLPIAVAYTHGALLSMRPPTAPIEGIELGAEAVAFPIGHHAAVAIALPHSVAGAGTLPAVAPHTGVVRGWLATAERAGRLLLPDETLAERVVAARCELALAGPCDPSADPVAFTLGVGQLVRMGEDSDPWLADLAAALERAAKKCATDWAFGAALDAADVVLHRAGQQRALRDLATVRDVTARAGAGAVPATPPGDDARFLGWVEGQLVRRGVLLPSGLPASWRGANFEVYGLPTAPASTVSYAVRWHGLRPAVLWEQDGDLVQLTAPVVAPSWSTAEQRGEALWPDPDDVDPDV